MSITAWVHQLDTELENWVQQILSIPTGGEGNIASPIFVQKQGLKFMMQNAILIEIHQINLIFNACHV
jgi:hypothetical protein